MVFPLALRTPIVCTLIRQGRDLAIVIAADSNGAPNSESRCGAGRARTLCPLPTARSHGTARPFVPGSVHLSYVDVVVNS